MLLLLTFCPPGPQPLMKFSSMSSSLRYTSWYNRTKSTAASGRCDLELNKELVITKCPFLGNKDGAIVFRPFHKRAAKGNISFYIVHYGNSTKNRSRSAKIAGHFGVCLFRGNAGDSNWSAVSCNLMQHAHSSLQNIKMAAVCKRFESSMICFLSEVLWSSDVYYFARGPQKTLECVKRPISKVNGDSGEDVLARLTQCHLPKQGKTTVRIRRVDSLVLGYFLL